MARPRFSLGESAPPEAADEVKSTPGKASPDTVELNMAPV